jgi:5-methyltetrahydrofolate--homocysteine methyltransferase
MSTVLQSLHDATVEGNAKRVKQFVQEALGAGEDAKKLLTDVMIPAMTEVGKRYEAGEYFVPELLLAGRAMKEGLAILKPHLVDASVKPAGRVAIGTVEGDLHDIGKNLVGMMLEGAGFEVVDLGLDVRPEKYVQAVRDGAKVIALSSLLTTTMPNMKRTIQALDEAGLRRQAAVIVGGAPVTQSYADEIGADGYAPDAYQAVGKVKALVGKAEPGGSVRGL